MIQKQKYNIWDQICNLNKRYEIKKCIRSTRDEPELWDQEYTLIFFSFYINGAATSHACIATNSLTRWYSQSPKDEDDLSSW